MKAPASNSMIRRPALRRKLAGCVLALTCLNVPALAADDVRDAKGEAPPNHVLLRETRGGAFYVARPLKEQYDKILSRVRTLRSNLDAQRVTGPDVLLELQWLRDQLNLLSARLEHDKVLVSPLKIHTERVETTFDLGPERTLVITAGRIHVEGWDQPQVKCVLDKTVLSADEKPVDKQLQAIKLVHQHGRAPQLLKNPVGPEAAADDRLILVEQSRVAAFSQGRVDTVQIDGLMDNLQLYAQIESPNGGGRSSGTQWQRDADLTVYVPHCKAVALRGCNGAVDVRGVRADLLLVPGGAWGGDHHDDDPFAVRDLHGSLTSVGVTLDRIESIHGDVNHTGRLPHTTETFSGDNQRTIFTTPRTLACSDIHGDLTAWFVRTDLFLHDIAGRIDVRNDFGRTDLTISSPLPDKPHRILSQSGRIDIHLPAQLPTLPILALTNSGTVQTNTPRDLLPIRTFALDNPFDPRQDWRGVASPTFGKSQHEESEISSRLTAALEDHDRSSGLDLISRDGTIRVELAK